MQAMPTAAQAMTNMAAQLQAMAYQINWVGSGGGGVQVPGWEVPELDWATDKIRASLHTTTVASSPTGKQALFAKMYGASPQKTLEAMLPLKVEVISSTGQMEMELLEVKRTNGLTSSGVVPMTHTSLYLRGSFKQWQRLIIQGTGRQLLVKTVQPDLAQRQWVCEALQWSGDSTTDQVEVTMNEASPPGVVIAGISEGTIERVPGRFAGDDRRDTSGDVPDVPDYCWGWRLFKVQGYDEDENVYVYGQDEPAFTIATARVGQLLSWAKPVEWAEARQTAKCLLNLEGKPVERVKYLDEVYSVEIPPIHTLQAPDPRCDCGIWAVWHPKDLPLSGSPSNYGTDVVVAKVRAWGDIVEAPRGFRAPYMEIMEVALVDEEGRATLGDDPQVSPLLEAVMKKYHVMPLSELIQENEPT